ncbi:uncharacterized protein N0V89_009315 [Didymosphaeria variabile]|uniref:DUF1640-domain-containing protein n=1 Tax=Didymosphaeria variabile TaxID=1932322 RepID=A0A9W8XD54_9PLEO|nr:uncharacterized protein N0V89_009315 [Didymosphaeria variabile]KAJ4347943.1 hypothetical protein N0V89_009315 [Didymosphaeria variabile]
MVTPRLPFLWPMLFKPPKACRTRAPNATRRTAARRNFAATSRPRQETISKRYGTAQEPAAHLRDQETQPDADEEAKTSPEPEPIEEEEEEESLPPTMPSTEAKSADADLPDEAAPPPLEPPKPPDAKPLDTVLHMPSPQEEQERKPPHLKTPPYVHHFDTYSLVKDLTKSGFTQDQSVTVMKAVRGILTDNMELARDGLVSKSNVENETYLFRAACSELRTEVGNTRKAEVERMRSERNQLQHEVDILSQRMGQDTSQLKDELKGLFDDRKMAVRNEQRHMESQIQKLGYKITVELNSDARSEVEGLRWILTRRAATAIGISAFLLFTCLRFMSYSSHQPEQKKKEDTPPETSDNSPATGKPTLGRDEPMGGELLTTEGGVSLA